MSHRGYVRGRGRGRGFSFKMPYTPTQHGYDEKNDACSHDLRDLRQKLQAKRVERSSYNYERPQSPVSGEPIEWDTSSHRQYSSINRSHDYRYERHQGTSSSRLGDDDTGMAYKEYNEMPASEFDSHRQSHYRHDSESDQDNRHSSQRDRYNKHDKYSHARDMSSTTVRDKRHDHTKKEDSSWKSDRISKSSARDQSYSQTIKTDRKLDDRPSPTVVDSTQHEDDILYILADDNRFDEESERLFGAGAVSSTSVVDIKKCSDEMKHLVNDYKTNLDEPLQIHAEPAGSLFGDTPITHISGDNSSKRDKRSVSKDLHSDKGSDVKQTHRRGDSKQRSSQVETSRSRTREKGGVSHRDNSCNQASKLSFARETDNARKNIALPKSPIAGSSKLDKKPGYRMNSERTGTIYEQNTGNKGKFNINPRYSGMKFKAESTAHKDDSICMRKPQANHKPLSQKRQPYKKEYASKRITDKYFNRNYKFSQNIKKTIGYSKQTGSVSFRKIGESDLPSSSYVTNTNKHSFDRGYDGNNTQTFDHLTEGDMYNHDRDDKHSSYDPTSHNRVSVTKHNSGFRNLTSRYHGFSGHDKYPTNLRKDYAVKSVGLQQYDRVRKKYFGKSFTSSSNRPGRSNNNWRYAQTSNTKPTTKTKEKYDNVSDTKSDFGDNAKRGSYTDHADEPPPQIQHTIIGADTNQQIIFLPNPDLQNSSTQLMDSFGNVIANPNFLAQHAQGNNAHMPVHIDNSTVPPPPPGTEYVFIPFVNQSSGMLENVQVDQGIPPFPMTDINLTNTQETSNAPATSSNRHLPGRPGVVRKNTLSKEKRYMMKQKLLIKKRMHFEKKVEEGVLKKMQAKKAVLQSGKPGKVAKKIQTGTSNKAFVGKRKTGYAKGDDGKYDNISDLEDVSDDENKYDNVSELEDVTDEDNDELHLADAGKKPIKKTKDIRITKKEGISSRQNRHTYANKLSNPDQRVLNIKRNIKQDVTDVRKVVDSSDGQSPLKRRRLSVNVDDVDRDRSKESNNTFSRQACESSEKRQLVYEKRPISPLHITVKNDHYTKFEEMRQKNNDNTSDPHDDKLDYNKNKQRDYDQHGDYQTSDTYQAEDHKLRISIENDQHTRRHSPIHNEHDERRDERWQYDDHDHEDTRRHSPNRNERRDERWQYDDHEHEHTRRHSSNHNERRDERWQYNDHDQQHNQRHSPNHNERTDERWQYDDHEHTRRPSPNHNERRDERWQYDDHAHEHTRRHSPNHNERIDERWQHDDHDHAHTGRYSPKRNERRGERWQYDDHAHQHTRRHRPNHNERKNERRQSNDHEFEHARRHSANHNERTDGRWQYDGQDHHINYDKDSIESKSRNKEYSSDKEYNSERTYYDTDNTRKQDRRNSFDTVAQSANKKDTMHYNKDDTSREHLKEEHIDYIRKKTRPYDIEPENDKERTRNSEGRQDDDRQQVASSHDSYAKDNLRHKTRYLNERDADNDRHSHSLRSHGHSEAIDLDRTKYLNEHDNKDISREKSSYREDRHPKNDRTTEMKHSTDFIGNESNNRQKGHDKGGDTTTDNKRPQDVVIAKQDQNDNRKPSDYSDPTQYHGQHNVLQHQSPSLTPGSTPANQTNNQLTALSNQQPTNPSQSSHFTAVNASTALTVVSQDHSEKSQSFFDPSLPPSLAERSSRTLNTNIAPDMSLPPPPMPASNLLGQPRFVTSQQSMQNQQQNILTSPVVQQQHTIQNLTSQQVHQIQQQLLARQQSLHNQLQSPQQLTMASVNQLGQQAFVSPQQQQSFIGQLQLPGQNVGMQQLITQQQQPSNQQRFQQIQTPQVQNIQQLQRPQNVQQMVNQPSQNIQTFQPQGVINQQSVVTHQPLSLNQQPTNQQKFQQVQQMLKNQLVTRQQKAATQPKVIGTIAHSGTSVGSSVSGITQNVVTSSQTSNKRQFLLPTPQTGGVIARANANSINAVTGGALVQLPKGTVQYASKSSVPASTARISTPRPATIMKAPVRYDGKHGTSTAELEDKAGDEDSTWMNCSRCNNQFVNVPLFKRHVRWHDYYSRNIKDLRCDDCQQAFPTTGLLREHISERHSGNSYSCASCDAVFSALFALFKHTKSTGHHTNVKAQYLCSHCKASFPTHEALVSHRKTSHPDGKAYNIRPYN